MSSVLLDDLDAVDSVEDGLRWLSVHRCEDRQSLTRVLDRAEIALHERPAVGWLLAELVSRFDAHPELTARGRYLMARVAAERGDLEAALSLIELSHADWVRAGLPLQALRTDLGRMQVLDDLGRHREAIALGGSTLAALADQQFPMAADQSLAGLIEATVHNNLGVAHSFLGDHENALRCYQRAESAYRAISLETEIAKTVANRGIELLTLGRARDAHAALVQARAAFQDAGDQLWAAKCAGNVAQADQLRGDLVSALTELRAGRRQLTDLGAAGEAARLQCILAEVYASAGLSEESAEEARSAARTLTALGLRHDAARALFAAAGAELDGGDLELASSTLGAAAELFTEVGDAYHLARTEQTGAEICWRRRDHAGARRQIARAADQLRAGGWLVGLAWAQLRQADFAPGESERTAALAAARSTVEDVGLPALRFGWALRQARALKQRGEVAEATGLLRDAISESERVRSMLPLAELRRAFGADHASAYDELVDVLTLPGSDAAEPALRASHRCRAVTLTDLLEGTVGLRRPASGPDTAPALERERADLSAIYQALVSTSEPALIPTLTQRARELERQLMVGQVDRGLLSSAGGSPVQRRHPSAPETPIITYHLLAEDLLIFVEVGGRVLCERSCGVRAELDHTLDQLQAEWSRGPVLARLGHRQSDLAARSAVDVLTRLHRLLIGPVAQHLVPSEDGAELIVVPHGRLHEVPFHALTEQGTPLLSRWSVVVTPTVVDGPEVSSEVSSAVPRGELLLVGVPDDAAPQIATEIDQIRSQREAGTVLTGPEATVAALRRSVPGPAQVHFACHGLYRAANPMFSSLRLADRWVTAAEVLELDFGAAVVTLSACESGRGDPAGVDPIGIAWAFLCAGASAVVASHWQVDDVAAASMMPEFHRRLAAGQSPPRALRATQVLTRDRWSHPYFWAPFTVVQVQAAPVRTRRDVPVAAAESARQR